MYTYNFHMLCVFFLLTLFSFSTAEELEKLINYALENSPRLKVYEHTKRALKSKEEYSKSLPNPSLTFGLNNLPLNRPYPSKYEPMSSMSFGIGQMYVLPVKREREAKVVRSEISLLEAQENQARKELIRDIKLAYIDWYYTMKSIDLYAKAKEELLALEKLAEANYKLGRANLSDLLSLKAELIRFDREIKDREAKVRLLKEELDYLVGDSFKLKGEEPKVEKIDIKALSEEAFPSLRVLEKEREKLKKEVERRQVEYLPDFELMAEYMIRPELDNMFSLRLSFGLPIRKSKREDLMVLEKLEEVKAKEREFENLRLLVRKEINSLRVEEERLKTLKELTERLIREKEAELKALELAYRYTKADFRDLLRLYRELWELRTNLLELEGELKKVYIRAEVFL